MRRAEQDTRFDSPRRQGAGSTSRAALRFGAPVVVAALGIVALLRAWPFGPDLQVDFGRELYLPWRVAQGDRLYLDVAHWSGPLSVTWHAFWFSWFGASLSVLKVSNALVCAGMAGAIHRIAHRLAGTVPALVTTGFFVSALAFAQALPLANYDYLTPYSHELTHGLALSLVGLVLLVSTEREGRRDPRVAWWCGVLLAGVFATKVEVMAAFAAALLVAFGLPFLRRTDGHVASGSAALRDLRRLGGGFALGVSLISAAVAWQSGFAAAATGWIEPWRILLVTNVSALTFYQQTMGTHDVVASLRLLFLGVMALGAGGGVIAIVSIGWRRFAPSWAIYLLILVWLLVWHEVPMSPAGMRIALAPVGLITAVLCAASLRRAHRSGDPRDLALASVLTFAVALTAKMALNAKLSHYGFALYMPATLVCIAALLGSFPKALAKQGGSAEVALLLGCFLVVALGLGLHTQTERHRSVRTAEVATNADAMRADFRAHAFNGALAHLEGLPPGTTVAVLPEGIMLNYLARREAPTRFVNFMPPELEMYGEQAIVEAFRANPPDIIVFMHKRAGLYGTPDFGRDYGKALHDFAVKNYRNVETWGDPPFDPTTRFGIRVLERRPDR